MAGLRADAPYFEPPLLRTINDAGTAALRQAHLFPFGPDAATTGRALQLVGVFDRMSAALTANIDAVLVESQLAEAAEDAWDLGFAEVETCCWDALVMACSRGLPIDEVLKPRICPTDALGQRIIRAFGRDIAIAEPGIRNTERDDPSLPWSANLYLWSRALGAHSHVYGRASGVGSPGRRRPRRRALREPEPEPDAPPLVGLRPPPGLDNQVVLVNWVPPPDFD